MRIVELLLGRLESKSTEIGALRATCETQRKEMEQMRTTMIAMQSPTPLTPPTLSWSVTLDELERLCTDVVLNPIAAIKRLRRLTGCGLKEGKDVVDRVRSLLLDRSTPTESEKTS